MGPTFFIMKNVLEEVFEQVGRNLKDYVKLTEIEPMYRLYFEEGKVFYPYRDEAKMIEELERVFPGNVNGYKLYLEKEKIKYDQLMPCLKVPYSGVKDFFSKQFIKSIPYLDAHVSLYKVLGRYFNDDDLKTAFTFQAKYIGMSPWEAPGTFSIISYIEHGEGIFHVEGGLNKLANAKAKVLEEEGGKISVDTPVKKVIVKNGEAVGVELENGNIDYADYVVVNADFGYAMENLFDKKDIKKYSSENLVKKKYSCSTFMLYLGVDKVYDNVPHHNIIFASDYKKNVEEITKTKVISEDISVYIPNASITDTTLAPKGKSTIYILVPVPNILTLSPSFKFVTIFFAL